MEIFFAILVGLILGLTLLTANLRGAIETCMVYVLFFWERKSMRALLKKNLVAHKQTNKLTSIIYALTLGCVIFLCVSLNLVIRATSGTTGPLAGSDIWITSDAALNATDIDPILKSFADDIQEFGYVTDSLRSVFSDYDDGSGIQWRDMAKQESVDGDMLAFSPASMFAEAMQGNIEWQSSETGLNLAEQMYTARGSQSFAIKQKYATTLYLDVEDYT